MALGCSLLNLRGILENPGKFVEKRLLRPHFAYVAIHNGQKLEAKEVRYESLACFLYFLNVVV